jgi:hypothetical protein
MHVQQAAKLAWATVSVSLVVSRIVVMPGASCVQLVFTDDEENVDFFGGTVDRMCAWYSAILQAEVWSPIVFVASQTLLDLHSPRAAGTVRA